MKKLYSFTLMELLICLLLVSFLAMVMVSNLNKSNTQVYDKITKTKLYKALDAVQNASATIIQTDAKCPMKAFMVNAAGTYEYALLSTETSSAVASLFGQYIKFQKSSLKFCDYTSTCSNNDIIGGKILGDIYIGFEKLSNISNCPNYYLPDSGSITGRGKCWGKLYIKIADKHNGDTLNKDVFIFGLGESGIAY